MIKYICDCCGKEIKKGEIKQIKVHDNYTNRVEKEGIHWCKDCVSNNGKPGFNFPILDTSEIEFEIELEKLKEETEELLGAEQAKKMLTAGFNEVPFGFKISTVLPPFLGEENNLKNIIQIANELNSKLYDK